MERKSYIKIYENANSLIDTAIATANKGNYGMAISLLILGVEELIKYQIVLSNSTEDKVFSEKEFEEVFKNHIAKHKLIEEFQTSISADFNKKFENYLLENILEENYSETSQEVRINRFKEMGTFLYTCYPEFNISDIEKKDFFEWLKRANDLKNRGFYVNFKDGNWALPSDLIQSDFDVALKYALMIKNHTSVVKDLDITDDELMGFLNKEI